MDICCDIESEEVRKLVLETARKNGLDTSPYEGGGQEIPSRYVQFNGGRKLSGNCGSLIGKEVSFNEFFAAISKPFVKPITVKGKAVEFYHDRITIGCTTIDATTIEAIYKRFNEQK